MIYHFNMTDETNFKSICLLATRVMGLPTGSLVYKNRTRNIQAARASAGYIGLTEENISREVVAKVLNRNRTATYHYERTHKKNFQRCSVYRDTFTKIYKEYMNVGDQKDFFINKRQMKNYLLQNKVTESKNSDVKLEVRSCGISCVINTSYFDYLNQLENIKFALTNYQYTVKII